MSGDAHHGKQHQRSDTDSKNSCTPRELVPFNLGLVAAVRVLTVPHVTTMY
jgi:hypothetical protein